MGEWAAFFSLCLCSPPIQTWFCLAFFSRVFVFRMHTTWACNRARFTLSVISASAINLSILCAVRRMARSIHFFSLVVHCVAFALANGTVYAVVRASEIMQIECKNWSTIFEFIRFLRKNGFHFDARSAFSLSTKRRPYLVC